MSRIAKAPIMVPSGVTVTINASQVSVKGSKGELQLKMHRDVAASLEDGILKVALANSAVEGAWAQAGTTRALLNNMVHGVSQGWSKKLQLVGVGYRAQSKGDVLTLSLGFSHPVDYPVPKGITVETPTQTDILVSGFDKQLVGQVASEIRAYRSPEPYKGKGVRYADEVVIRKETKKKK